MFVAIMGLGRGGWGFNPKSPPHLPSQCRWAAVTDSCTERSEKRGSRIARRMGREENPDYLPFACRPVQIGGTARVPMMTRNVSLAVAQTRQQLDRNQ